MAFYLAHAGEKLYKIDTAGGAVELALPSGVTISSSRRGRFAILDRTVAFVHAPSINLQIDPNLTVRILTPTAPTAAPTAAAGAAGLLTGSFRWKISFRIMNGTRVISESALSDESSAVTLTSQQGSLSNIPVSSQPGVNARGVYRTLNGGTEYFFIGTIADNTTTTYNDNTSDEEAAASDPADPDLGAPPGSTTSDYIESIVAWNDRFWILSHNEPDKVFFSGLSTPYAFSPDNFVSAKPVGEDLAGGTGFIARRNELGVGKRRSFHKIIGTDEDDFEMITISEEVGLWAEESAWVIRDVGYFLAEDGVYEFGPKGILSKSRDKVHPWFTTDDFFNRALFSQAFANYNQKTDMYQLFLASAGSSAIDRWIGLDMKTGNWYGPHKTDEPLTPSSACVFEDNDGLVTPVIGTSEGKIWRMNQSAFRDGDSAIEFEVVTNRHSQGQPDEEKYFGELTMHSKAEGDGTLTIEARVGGMDARMGPVVVTTMTRGAQNPTTLISLVTVTTAEAHQFGDLSDAIIAGAVETDYNGTWTINVVDATTFTFELPTATPTTPATGSITALDPAKAEILHDLTLDRERLPRLGVGRLCQLTLKNAEIDQPVEIYGYEVTPVVTIGRR